MHSLDGFYAASAGVAGALIGLLFVAVSVAGERLTAQDASAAHRIRAAAALTSFTNALTVSLFSLIYGAGTGDPAVVVAVLGLVFVSASILSLRGQPRAVRDVLFLVTLLAAFTAQLIFGLELEGNAGDTGAARGIAVLVVVFFLVGIARSWELVEGPQIGLGRQLLDLLDRSSSRPEQEAEDRTG